MIVLYYVSGLKESILKRPKSDAEGSENSESKSQGNKERWNTSLEDRKGKNLGMY